MPATRATTIQQRQQIMELVQNGHSCAAIAQQLTAFVLDGTPVVAADT